MTTEKILAIPGVPLDEGRHPWAAWLARRSGSPSVLQGAPSAEDVMGLADMLLVALESLEDADQVRLWESWLHDPAPLGPCCQTESQAAGLAATIWGQHRFHPESDTDEALTTLQAVGDIVAAPIDSPEAYALLLLSLLARGRWRGSGLVRSPRDPQELLELPAL